MSNFFGSSSSNNESSQAELGSRLYNIKQSSIGAESVLSILPDNNVVVNTCSSFGKSLLNVSSLNGLVGLINSADSKVEVIDSGTGSIDFTLDNSLKLSVKNLYTEVLNEMRALNINPLTDLEYSLGTYNKRWNNIYGNKIVDCQAVRSGASSIPFMQNTNVSTVSGQNVLWQHTTNETTPTYFQLLLETKGINTDFERMQISSYRTAYRNLHLQPSGKVLIGGDYSAINNSTISTLDVNGATTVRGHITPDATNQRDLGASGTRFRTLYTTDVSVSGNIYSSSSTTPLIFAQDTTERMRITSTGLGIGTTTPSEQLDVVGNGKISGNVYCKSLLSSYRYPITAMTSNSSQSCIASSSTTLSTYDAYNAFDYNSGTFWHSNTGVYNNGPYTGAVSTTVSAVAYNGEWLQIQLPSAITLTAYAITCRSIGSNLETNQAPNSWVIAGSNNGTNWFLLDTRTAVNTWNSTIRRIWFNFSNFTSYSYYRLICTQGGIASSYVPIAEFELYEALSIPSLNTNSLDVVGNAKITGNILFDADNQRSVGSSGQALSAIHCHTGNFKSIAVHSATAGNIATSAKPFNTLFVSNIGSSETPVQTLYADVWATSSTSGLRCANNLVLATDLSLPTITWYDVNAKSMILVDTVNTTDGGKLSYDSANSEIVIGTTSTSVERVRIGANGIKTSVNILPTDANRTIGSSSAKFNTLYTSTILNPDANLILGRGTTSTIAISASGMSIGSGSNPTEALNVTGNIKVSGNILPNVHNVPKIGTSNTDRFLEGWFGTVYGNGVALTSDRRLKDNIKPITNALETVMKMKPVEYKMKGRVRLHTGFISDEMKNLYNGEDWACFVEAQDEFKTQSLQYTEVVAVLTSAIQEVNNRLTKVENRKLVGGSIIDTSSLTEDMTQIYERLDHLSRKLVELENQPVRPQLHRCLEVSRINELYDRICNLESNESKSSSSEDFELMHSLMEKNHQLELRVNDLESKLTELKSQPKVESKSYDLLESDGGVNMNELLQQKNFELETRLIKLEKQNKRLVQAVNKLLKSNDV
jgi:hypothetical protein